MPAIRVRCEKKQRENTCVPKHFSQRVFIVEGDEKSWFLTNISLYLGNNTGYGSSYNGRRTGTYTRSAQRCKLE